MIKKRELGKSNLKVSEIGMGLWAAGGSEWGGVIDDKEILNAIDYALDVGVNFFDTADIYGDGHSEILLGKAMKGRRDKFILATKVGWRGFDRFKLQTAYTKPEKLKRDIEGNLRRLGTDYIDVLQSHIHFRDPTMEIMREVFQELQDEGKLKAYGVSTTDVYYLKAFNEKGHCSSLQTDYSILNRTPERDLFPYCDKNNIGIIIRGPLAMGILTGKLTLESTFKEGDFRQSWVKNPEERDIFLKDLQTVEKLRSMATERTMTQLALQFVLTRTEISTVIPGVRTVEQLKENIETIHRPQLSQEELKKIDEIIPPRGGRKIWPAQ